MKGYSKNLVLLYLEIDSYGGLIVPLKDVSTVPTQIVQALNQEYTHAHAHTNTHLCTKFEETL